jgi:bacterioferritin-associated ferredoxin
MYVCVCQAVTERQVRDAVSDGIHSLRALREHLGVASECGKCARCAQSLLKECRGCSNGVCAADCREE